MQTKELKPGLAKCLKCQKMFDSWDVCANRICPRCTRMNLREYIPRRTSTRVHAHGGGGATDRDD